MPNISRRPVLWPFGYSMAQPRITVKEARMKKILFSVLVLSALLIVACNMPDKKQEIYLPQPTATATAEPYVFITVIPFWDDTQGVGAKIITKVENGAVPNTVKWVLLVNGLPYEEGTLNVGEGTIGIDPKDVQNFQLIINGDPVAYGENGQTTDPINKRIP